MMNNSFETCRKIVQSAWFRVLALPVCLIFVFLSIVCFCFAKTIGARIEHFGNFCIWGSWFLIAIFSFSEELKKYIEKLHNFNNIGLLILAAGCVLHYVFEL